MVTNMAKKQVNLGGRPTVMTSDVVIKLEQAFAIDATVEEACSYAEISRNTFYEYLKKNPEFQDRIDDLRNRPILKARQTIVKSLDNPNQAQWYLERKKKREFAQRNEYTGADGEPLNLIYDSTFASPTSTADKPKGKKV